jgi:PAS domain S-box-containing protein
VELVRMEKQANQLPDLSYRTLFTALPESFIVIAADDPVFTIVDANAAYAKLNLRRPKDIIGKPLLEVFPDVSEKYLKTGVSEMIRSLQRVIRTGKSHHLDKLRYDIKGPDGTFIERYWRPEHHPILDNKGHVAFILQTKQDITEEIMHEQRLRQVERQLNDALAIGQVGSWQWDIRSDKVVADKNLAYIFGLDPSESLEGMPFDTFMSAIHPDDRERVVDHIRKTLKTGKAFNDECRTFGADGTIHWVIARGQVEYDAQDRATSYPGVVVDITDRKRAEEEVKRQSTFIETITRSIADGVYATDCDGNLTFVNDAAQRMFGYRSRELIGQNIHQLTHTQNKGRVSRPSKACRILRSTLKGQVTVSEDYLRGKDDNVFPVILTAAPIFGIDGNIAGGVFAFSDISKQKRTQAEAEAAKSRARVSRDQAVLLRRQNEELVALNRTKDEFIALASHQLRTPATGVKQYLGMVLQGFAEPLSPGQQNFLERAYECNERQLRIVEDILRVAQIDLDKIQLHPQPTNICELVQDIIDNHLGMLSNRHQKLTYNQPKKALRLDIDAERLRMAIDNIIDNAIKYTPERRSITVNISASQDKKQCIIEVIDHGVGIRKADIGKLFQKFSRLDNPLSVEVGGNGLGLYWSKKIINLHGGDVRATSHVGRGSTFTITLPMHVAQKSTAQKLQAARR